MFPFFRSIFSSRRGRLVISVLVLAVVTTHLVLSYMDNKGVLKPMSGGSLREGAVGMVTGANPLFSQFNPIEDDIVRLVYSGLTKYDPKQRKVVPDLATWSVTDNNKTYTFFLQPNALWHDGEKVTADDVVFTYNLFESEKFSNTYLKQMFAGTKVEKKDDQTVVFSLSEPFSNFPTQTTLGILPKHIWEKVPEEEIEQSALNQHPMGSGPFKVDGSLLQAQSASEDKLITLSRFDGYFGEKSYLDKLVFDVFPTFDALYEKRNSLEAIRNVDFEYLQKFKDMQRFQMTSYPASKYFAIFFNTESTVMKNWKTRLGFKLAINKDTLLAPYAERIQRVDTPFLTKEADTWLTTPGIEKANGSLFDTGWKYVKDEEIKKYFAAPTTTIPTPKRTATTAETPKETATPDVTAPASPAVPEKPPVEPQFAAVLKKYPRTATGTTLVDTISELKKYRYNEKGEECDLHFVSVNTPPYLGQIAEQVAANWKELGCKVDLTLQNPRDILETIQNRSYDAIFIGQELGYDQDVFAYFHSSQVTKKGYNLSNFKNKKLDGYLEELRTVPSDLSYDEALEFRKKRIDLVSTLFRDEVPAMILFQPLSYFAYDGKFQDIDIGIPVFPKDRFFFVTKWYIHEQKALSEPFSFGTFFQWISQHLTS